MLFHTILACHCILHLYQVEVEVILNCLLGEWATTLINNYWVVELLARGDQLRLLRLRLQNFGWWEEMILRLWGSYQESIGVLRSHITFLHKFSLLLLLGPLKVFSMNLRSEILFFRVLRFFKILWVWRRETVLILRWLYRGNNVSCSPLRLSSSIFKCFSFSLLGLFVELWVTWKIIFIIMNVLIVMNRIIWSFWEVWLLIIHVLVLFIIVWVNRVLIIIFVLSLFSDLDLLMLWLFNRLKATFFIVTHLSILVSAIILSILLLNHLSHLHLL
jgi:hypothetical protein